MPKFKITIKRYKYKSQSQCDHTLIFFQEKDTLKAALNFANNTYDNLFPGNGEESSVNIEIEEVVS